MKKNLLWLLSALLAFAAVPASALTPVMIQDYEKASSLPKLWVVGIPNENASVQLSTDHPFDGKQSLKLHYHFVGTGQFQYLGIPNTVRVQGPVHKLRFRLYGNNSKCSYGLQVLDAGGETHQYRSLSSGQGQGGTVDFTGWKEVVFDLDAPHETWGGDRNGKVDYPLATIVLTVGQPVEREGGKEKLMAAEGDLYFDSLSVDSELSAEETLSDRQIAVVSPDYCSAVNGDTKIVLSAHGFKTATAKCWKQGPGFGSDSTVATIALDAQGRGSFVFPADQYPHGPLCLRINGQGSSYSDNCYLQLYNKSGVSWNEGIPKDPPPAAQGMSLLFADDFSGPLSIGGDNTKATYYDHKPPHGWQDFSFHPFTDHQSPKDPFARVDTYLRIRASDQLHSAGLICSVKSDGSGVKATVPCYFEARFIGPNAVGAWPAFWLLTDNLSNTNQPCDELDILEAYGGEGPGHPNAHDIYMITPHAWSQKGSAAEALTDKFYRTKSPTHMSRFGIPSTWYEAMHTYGCKITETDTIYYCDNIEVVRHPTLPVSKRQPLFFMLNLATGGGWPVDLSRYHGTADMYIDFVRVYQGTSIHPIHAPASDDNAKSSDRPFAIVAVAEPTTVSRGGTIQLHVAIKNVTKTPQTIDVPNWAWWAVTDASQIMIPGWPKHGGHGPVVIFKPVSIEPGKAYDHTWTASVPGDAAAGKVTFRVGVPLHRASSDKAWSEPLTVEVAAQKAAK